MEFIIEVIDYVTPAYKMDIVDNIIEGEFTYRTIRESNYFVTEVIWRKYCAGIRYSDTLEGIADSVAYLREKVTKAIKPYKCANCGEIIDVAGLTGYTRPHYCLECDEEDWIPEEYAFVTEEYINNKVFCCAEAEEMAWSLFEKEPIRINDFRNALRVWFRD